MSIDSSNLERISLLLVGGQRGHHGHFLPLGAVQAVPLDRSYLYKTKLGSIVALFTYAIWQPCLVRDGGQFLDEFPLPGPQCDDPLVELLLLPLHRPQQPHQPRPLLLRPQRPRGPLGLVRGACLPGAGFNSFA